MLNALIAVFLVIATGWFLKTRGIVSPPQWLGVERLTYQALFPSVVIYTLAMADLHSLPVLPMGATLVFSILTMAALLLLARPLLGRLGVGGPAFTSVFQGSVRWNTFVALALAASLHGRTGAALMAIAVASMIPLLNVLCVLVLARYASGDKPMRGGAILRSIVYNPFIWSSAIGLSLNPVQAYLPAALTGAIDILGRASLGIGLLVVGASLDLARLARPQLAHGLAVVLKLMVMPVFAAVFGHWLGVSGTAMEMTLIAAAMPTATAAYFLARELGGDAPLMAEITTLQTLLAMATLPLVLLLK